MKHLHGHDSGESDSLLEYHVSYQLTYILPYISPAMLGRLADVLWEADMEEAEFRLGLRLFDLIFTRRPEERGGKSYPRPAAGKIDGALEEK